MHHSLKEESSLPEPTSQRWYTHTLWSSGSVYIAFLTNSNSGTWGPSKLSPTSEGQDGMTQRTFFSGLAVI